MNGVNKILKTEFWSVDLEDLKTVKTELEWLAKKYQIFAKRTQDIIQNLENKTEYEIEELLTDICDFVNDCRVCPLRFNCKFVVEACDEIYNCESCPRLRICMKDRTLGLKGDVQ